MEAPLSPLSSHLGAKADATFPVHAWKTNRGLARKNPLEPHLTLLVEVAGHDGLIGQQHAIRFARDRLIILVYQTEPIQSFVFAQG